MEEPEEPETPDEPTPDEPTPDEPEEEPVEELPPQTGVTYTKNNSIIYMLLILLNIISINVMFIRER